MPATCRLSLGMPSRRRRTESDPVPVLEELAAAMRSQADAELSRTMSAYMKDRFPFLGIARPERAALAKPFAPRLKKMGAEAVDPAVEWLYGQPEREFHYVAIDFARAMERHWTPDLIGRWEWMLRTHAWWDSVDMVASNMVGPHFQRWPFLLDDFVARWAESDDLWLNRTTVVFQLKYKEKTDVALLVEMVERFKGSNEFFLQKAIGWALRELAKTQPEFVEEYVASADLKPLSRREALKNLGNDW